MNRLYNFLFNLFIVFLFIYPFWYKYEIVNVVFVILFLIVDFAIFINKKIKIKIFDIILLTSPLFYFLPYFFGKNVFPLKDSFINILFDFSLILTLIILKSILNKSKIISLLNCLLVVSLFYFFLPFLFEVWPYELMDFHIYSYFGDTYLNSIDRFYGSLDYCNASALFFAICIFVCLFKEFDKVDKSYFELFILYINFLGLTFTFSKIVTFSFILISVFCFIYFLRYRKIKQLINYLLILVALSIPLFLMVNVYRNFLINLNICFFIFYIFLFYILFIFFIELFRKIFYFSKKIFITFLLMFCGMLILMFYKPISIPLKINNVYRNNDFILTDFILNSNADYDIELGLSNNEKSDVTFSLCKLYLDNLHPTEEILFTKKASNKIFFSFLSDSNAEYYYIRVNNLSNKSKLKINYMKLNGEDYLINSFLIPYSYVHQFDLMKYDKESISHRLWYYEDSFNILKKHGFFIGQGLGTFKFYASSYDKKYLENDPHSYLFQLWLDIGIVGLFYVIYIYFYGIFFIIYYRNNRNKFVWFCIYGLCIVILPIDAVFSIEYLKMLLVMSFLFLSKPLGKNRHSS